MHYYFHAIENIENLNLNHCKFETIINSMLCAYFI